MENWRTIAGIGAALAGLLWFLFPGIKIPLPKPRPIEPDDAVEPTGTLDRVQVFATLDRLRQWFEEDGNAAGVSAMIAGSRALIDEEPLP